MKKSCNGASAQVYVIQKKTEHLHQIIFHTKMIAELILVFNLAKTLWVTRQEWLRTEEIRSPLAAPWMYYSPRAISWEGSILIPRVENAPQKQESQELGSKPHAAIHLLCGGWGGLNLHPWSFIFSTVKNRPAFLVLRLYDYLITKFNLPTNHHGTKHSKKTTLLSTNSLIKSVVLFCFFGQKK